MDFMTTSLAAMLILLEDRKGVLIVKYVPNVGNVHINKAYGSVLHILRFGYLDFLIRY